MTEETPIEDPVFSRICESATRLMAGAVHRPTLKELQKTVQAASGAYPWQAVVDRILREPCDPGELTAQALRAQRDWIVRGGRETPGKTLRYRAKSLLARMVARLLFLVILIPIVIALLVLVKERWPDLDIYRINGWLAALWPGVFGR